MRDVLYRGEHVTIITPNVGENREFEALEGLVKFNVHSVGISSVISFTHIADRVQKLQIIEFHNSSGGLVPSKTYVRREQTQNTMGWRLNELRVSSVMPMAGLQFNVRINVTTDDERTQTFQIVYNRGTRTDPVDLSHLTTRVN